MTELLAVAPTAALGQAGMHQEGGNRNRRDDACNGQGVKMKHAFFLWG